MIKFLLIFFSLLLGACSSDEKDSQETTEEDTGCSISMNLLHAETLDPSVVRLFFTMRDCEDNGISDRAAEDFTLTENGTEISGFESDKQVLPSSMGYDMRTLLLLDMSGSVISSGNLEQLQSAAIEFVKGLTDKQMVGVYAFDGRQQLQEVVAFTQNTTFLVNGINGLTDYQLTDASTNLNGAVVSGLQKLDAYSTQVIEGLFQGTLIVFTDGTDQAGWNTNAEAVAASQATTHSVYTIGLGGEVDEEHLATVGGEGSWTAEGVSELGTVFSVLSDLIINRSDSLYIMAYCSPKRHGYHDIRLSESDSHLDHMFSANGFQGGCTYLDFFDHKSIEELSPGDLVISEIMHDPVMVTDYRGEWFEVYNASADYINLRGLIVAGNGAEGFTVEEDFMLANGDYFLFATRDNPEQNGGMTNVDHRYYFDTFALSVLDTISLEAQSGLTIDFVSFGESLGFPVAYGASLSLSTLNSTDNDEPLNWCVSTTPFGDGDLGTPGWPNDLCE